jgi:hypothetical protein
MIQQPCRALLRLAVLAALPVFGAILPARAQVPDDARCWVAIRVTGPEAQRVSEEEAHARLRLRCRTGDALVFLSDAGQPLGAMAARYCDLGKSVVVERMAEDSIALPGNTETRVPVSMLTCVYRGAPRLDR